MIKFILCFIAIGPRLSKNIVKDNIRAMQKEIKGYANIALRFSYTNYIRSKSEGNKPNLKAKIRFAIIVLLTKGHCILYRNRWCKIIGPVGASSLVRIEYWKSGKTTIVPRSELQV